jgi:outer membrane receptor protein involved in Fe transport
MHQRSDFSPSLFQAPILPGINAENYSSLGVTFGGGFETYIRYSNTVGMNLTKQFSKHTLKFGGNFDDQRINNSVEANGISTGEAAFNFRTALTSCDPNGAAVRVSRLIAGPACRATQSPPCCSGLRTAAVRPLNIDPAMGMHNFGAYIQDQWRVTPRLTVNVGVRYENQRPATERINRLMYFNTTAREPHQLCGRAPPPGRFRVRGTERE